MNENFLNHLKEVFHSKKEVNQSYSLRAFANYLDINVSTLSQIFRGKRKLSDATCLKLGHKMGLEIIEIHSIMKGSQELPEYKTIAIHDYERICNWYHYAILELTHLSCFKPDASWISQTLSLDILKVTQAISDLKEVELLQISEAGEWIDQSDYLSTCEYEFTTESLQNMQKQILEKGISAMQDIPFEKRSQSSTTFQVNSKKIDLAKKKILQFKRELTELMQRDDDSDEVYHLCMSLYPVTKNYSMELT